MIHLFKVGRTHLVLDVESGALHELDSLSYQVLQHMEAGHSSLSELTAVMAGHNPEEIKTIYEEIQELIAAGLLYSKPQLETYQPQLEDFCVKALCLHIAHDCNMRCRYCFASTGEYHTGKRELMSLEVGKQAIDFVLKTSGDRRHLEIDFFGGEPLLGFSVIKELVKYGNEQAEALGKIIRYTITTNGILLNEEVQSFANKHNIQMILSLDGRPEVHNRMRPLVGGQPSYHKVIKNFKRLVETQQQKNYFVRGTYTAYNLDFTNDILSILDEGFDSLSLEPVVTDPKNDYALSEKDLPKLFSEYDKLTDIYEEKYREGNPFQFFHFELDLNQGPCLAKRLTGCGAGLDYLAVAPNGDLYPCHQLVGETDLIVGHVSEPDKLNRKIQEEFMNAHVFNKEDCKKCWARYFCSGGCHSDAYYHSGDILKPVSLSCALQKKRLECALALQARLTE